MSIEANVEEARKRRNQPLKDRLEWFGARVRGGGPWDYKQASTTERQKLQYGRFGNYHYDRVGTALDLPEEILHAGAGVAQYLSGNWQPQFGLPALQGGDDPVDQAWVDRGISYERRRRAAGR